MNLDKELVGEIMNVGQEEGPVVVINEKEIARQLGAFLKVRRNVNIVFGKILSQFGFTKDDIITLKNINYNMNSVTFEYSVNLVNDSNNKITLKFAALICDYVLYIRNKDKVITCDVVVYSKNNIALKVRTIEEKLDNDRLYSRGYDWSASNYEVVIGNKKIRLYLNKPNDNDYQRLMVIEHEKELEEYLKNIDESISIDKIYKDIEMFLEDINLYKEVKLEISSLDKDNDKVSDLLVLKDGECDTFMITRGNKRVNLKSNGSWEYNYSDELYSISSIGDDNRVTYSVSANDKNSLRECAVWSDLDFDILTEEVEDTKKLVREMFPKKR